MLLDGFEIRGVGGDAPDLPAIDASISAFDWGHPLGLAVVFADAKGIPRKRFVDDGHLIRLVSLPPGKYLHVAYHPSGLALAFVVEGAEGQEIWLSTNEGEDPQRLIFSERGTEFTSLAFTPNGRSLWWTAQHEEGYPELHFMKLETRTGFGTAWRGTEGTAAGGLRLPPTGALQAVTEGKTCEQRTALVLDRGETRRAIPDETRPTEALGWLDRTTLLVAAGGCEEATDLFAVDGLGQDAPAALVLDIEIAAPRTQVSNPPRTCPHRLPRRSHRRTASGDSALEAAGRPPSEVRASGCRARPQSVIPTALGARLDGFAPGAYTGENRGERGDRCRPIWV